MCVGVAGVDCVDGVLCWCLFVCVLLCVGVGAVGGVGDVGGVGGVGGAGGAGGVASVADVGAGSGVVGSATVCMTMTLSASDD